MSEKKTVSPELVSYLHGATEPCILMDRDYRILIANPAYQERYGGCEEVVGRTCFDVSHRYQVPCDEAGESCPMAISLASGKREKAIHLHRTPVGETYENIELAPICDGNGEIIFFVEKFEPFEVKPALAGNDVLVGRSPAFMRVLELIARVAPTDTTVLLEGETGTGKELAARAIHDSSLRAAQPFVVVECSGLPETLFESELFGYEKGAFTGATALKYGLIEEASGGTLFLDEVSEIPLSMQVKLLRLIETGTYRRVGGNVLRHADIRLVSATNHLLKDQVAAKRFRQDLYYRLNTFRILLPRLHERKMDIPMLVDNLLKRVARSRTLRVSEQALAILVEYECPGNIRELRNILEYASVMCDGEMIHPEHLPDALLGANKNGFTSARLVSPEKTEARTDAHATEEAMLRSIIEGHRGTRKALARKLGVSERTIYRKLSQMSRKMEDEFLGENKTGSI